MSLFTFNNCRGSGVVSETPMSTHRNSKNFIHQFFNFPNLFSTCWGDDDNATNDAFLLPDHVAEPVEETEIPVKETPVIMIVEDNKTLSPTTTTTTINSANKDDASIVSVHRNSKNFIHQFFNFPNLFSTCWGDDDDTTNDAFLLLDHVIEPDEENDILVKETPVIMIVEDNKALSPTTTTTTINSANKDDASIISVHRNSKNVIHQFFNFPNLFSTSWGDDDDTTNDAFLLLDHVVEPVEENENPVKETPVIMIFEEKKTLFPTTNTAINSAIKDDTSVHTSPVSASSSSSSSDDESLSSNGSTKTSSTVQSSSRNSMTNKEPVQSDNIQVIGCSTVVGPLWEYLVGNIEVEAVVAPVTPSKDDKDDASVVSIHTSLTASDSSSSSNDDESLSSTGSIKSSSTLESSNHGNTNHKEPVQSDNIQVNDCTTVVEPSLEHLVDDIEDEKEQDEKEQEVPMAPSKDIKTQYCLLIIGFGVVSYLMVRGGVANSFCRM